MIGRAAATGLPGRDERVRDAAAVADERSGQGRGDTRVAPPGHGAGTPTRQGKGAVHPERPDVPGGTAAPAAARRAPSAAAAGAPGHGAALAPGPAGTPPCHPVPSEASGAAANRALRPGPHNVVTEPGLGALWVS